MFKFFPGHIKESSDILPEINICESQFYGEIAGFEIVNWTFFTLVRRFILSRCIGVLTILMLIFEML